MNDIHTVSNNLNFILYADETTLTSPLCSFTYGGYHDINRVSTLINSEITNMSEWLSVNKLSLNANKTKFMIFHNYQKVMTDSDIPQLEINNTAVERVTALALSQCTLAGPVYTGMPLECHWLTQCTLEYHWATEWILAGYTGTPLEKLSWNSPTLECHWRNLIESAPHWDATGETLTFSAYTGTPLEGQ